MRERTIVFRKPVLRYPRLDTVLMVEQAIENSKGNPTVRELWQRLPKKVMWQTLLATLDYLEYSGKISIEGNRRVSWVWSPASAEQLKRNGLSIIHAHELRAN